MVGGEHSDRQLADLRLFAPLQRGQRNRAVLEYAERTRRFGQLRLARQRLRALRLARRGGGLLIPFGQNHALVSAGAERSAGPRENR